MTVFLCLFRMHLRHIKLIKVNPRRGLNDCAQIFETCMVCLEDSAKKCVLL